MLAFAIGNEKVRKGLELVLVRVILVGALEALEIEMDPCSFHSQIELRDIFLCFLEDSNHHLSVLLYQFVGSLPSLGDLKTHLLFFDVAMNDIIFVRSNHFPDLILCDCRGNQVQQICRPSTH